jgi:MscS family membrane protein
MKKMRNVLWALLLLVLSLPATIAAAQADAPALSPTIAAPAAQTQPSAAASETAAHTPSDTKPNDDNNTKDLHNLTENLLTVLGPTFKDTPWWAWVGLLSAIFLSLLVGKIAQTILRKLAKTWTDRGWRVRGIIFDNAAGPANLAALTVGLFIGLTLIRMDGSVRNFSNHIIEFLANLAAGWFLFNLVDVIDVALRLVVSKTNSNLDNLLVPLVRKTLRIFLVIIFALLIAQNVFGMNITGWIAGLGIVGLAVSLAAQDSIRNLFGSITVLFDKPFVVGDYIAIDGTEGIIEEVGFRSTRIRTPYNSLVTLPNANLINASVDNFGRRQYRRWKTALGVQYDTTPQQLIAFTEGIRELVRTHPYTRKDFFQVYCNEFADSSLNVLLIVFFEVNDYSTELRERERLFLDIVRLAHELDVSFAFPTRTLHLFQHPMPAEKPAAPAIPQPDTEDRAATQGIRLAQQITRDQPWQQQKPPLVTFQPGPTLLPDK